MADEEQSFDPLKLVEIRLRASTDEASDHDSEQASAKQAPAADESESTSESASELLRLVEARLRGVSSSDRVDDIVADCKGQDNGRNVKEDTGLDDSRMQGRDEKGHSEPDTEAGGKPTSSEELVPANIPEFSEQAAHYAIYQDKYSLAIEPSKASGIDPATTDVPSGAAAAARTEEDRTPGAYAFAGGASLYEDIARQQNRANLADTNGQNAGLTVARQVTEEGNNEGLPVAQEFQERAPDRENRPLEEKKKTATYIALGLILTAAIVILVVVFTIDGKSRNGQLPNSISDTPTASPTSAESYILALLPEPTVSAIVENGTAQALAHKWLVDDPSLMEYPAWRILQRFALAVLYYGTDGDSSWYNSTDWLSYSLHECFWHSSSFNASEDYTHPCGSNFADVSVDLQTDGHYTSLGLKTNGLDGQLPSELNWLTALASIELQGNLLTGTLTSQVGLLTNLTVLDLSSNALSGTIPSEVFSLSTLDSLQLHTNGFSGTLASEVGLLMTKNLFLEENFMTGTLPTEIAQMPNILELYLDRNSFSGTIYSDIGRMHSLKTIWLGHNNMTSTIPTEFGKLSNLYGFSLNSNSLVGTVPSELGLIPGLKWIYLFENMLSSTIPLELWQQARLVDVRVYSNQFTGSIPTEIGLLTDIEILDLEKNELSSTIPTQLGQLTKLIDIFLSSNQLSGSVPSELGNLHDLDWLFVLNNQLTSLIPSELGQLSMLREAHLQSNDLSGPIPSQLGNLPVLQALSLQENNLSGTIPEELGMLGSVFDVNLQNNTLLSGVVPEDLCMIDNLHFDCNFYLCGCGCNCSGGTILEANPIDNSTMGSI